MPRHKILLRSIGEDDNSSQPIIQTKVHPTRWVSRDAPSVSKLLTTVRDCDDNNATWHTPQQEQLAILLETARIEKEQQRDIIQSFQMFLEDILTTVNYVNHRGKLSIMENQIENFAEEIQDKYFTEEIL